MNFQKQPVKIRQQAGINEIFDPVRKKWLRLRRKNGYDKILFNFFLLKKNIPSSLIAVEKEIKLGELKKRCDIVVYNRQSQPWMIIECKEMNMMLSEKTLEQILRYHITFPAKYLVITNGSYCFGFEKNNNRFIEIDFFPEFEL